MDIALFSPSSLFAEEDRSSSDDDNSEAQQHFVERKHNFPGMDLTIREFSFHQLNANLLWPGTFAFADWLVQHRSCLQGRRIIELGSGTGALAIFLRKSFDVDITTSDYNDQEIEENIAYNCEANGIVPALPHLKHSWGDAFPNTSPGWDLVLASDILLYVKQYPNLIKTLSFLLKMCKLSESQSVNSKDEELSGEKLVRLPSPAFLMSWRRRIGKEDESQFFTGCKDAGLDVHHLGSRVYCIVPGKSTDGDTAELITAELNIALER
uniref:Uncharacterized protein n=2 Tax=Kalanchoe fedtschenkoi TaxID=63787 RepID=A0A7N0T3F0_KALFE